MVNHENKNSVASREKVLLLFYLALSWKNAAFTFHPVFKSGRFHETRSIPTLSEHSIAFKEKSV